MADQIDPEQIRRANEAFELFTNSLSKSKTAEEKKQEAQERFGKSLGKSAAELGSSLYKGEKGVGQFGDAVESATGALSMLVLALGPFSLAAKAVAVGLALLGKGINAAAKQGDALYKSYQDLSKAGATASDGISGVFRNMQNLGYGIEELDKMVQLVTQNSETLAKFSMTAADGTNAFAEGMAQIQRDGGLRLLGKTTDDINSAGAAFIRQQVTMGRTQKDVGDSLGAKTKQYILDLDRLQRLTGTSADALQKQQEDLLSEDAYNVYMKSLEDQGAAGEAQKKKIEEVTARLPMYEKLIAQAIGGNIEAQQQLFFIAPDLIKDLRDPVKSTADTLKTFNTQATNADKAFSGLAALGGGTREVVGSISDLRKSIAATSDIDARNAAAEKNAKVLDKSTQNLTEAQIANMNSRDALQGFVQLGVAPATSALESLASAVDDVTSILPGAKSRPGKGMSTPGYGAQGTGTRGGSVASMAAGAATGAVVGSVVPVIGTGIGAAIGAAAGYFGYGALGGASDKPEDYLKFGGQSGSKEAFGKLNPDIQKSLMAAGKQYKDITGNMLTINSAFRDSEKQKELYDAWIARGKTGMPVAPPGRSSHETGQAVDIEQGKNDRQAISALNAAGLFQTVANDPVHFSKTSGYKFGGIATGPSSGYQTLLHGTEAVVPLPDGKTIPVEIPGFTTNLSDQTNLMSAQLDKLDELVRVMQNQVSVSTKILQAAA